MFPDDPVASLDALRRAEAAFAPLSEGFEPAFKRGLSATFTRAEAAIVNRSGTDLRVQAAVLRGGFQRVLYTQALEQAAGDNLPRARTLLDVLAADLGFAGPVVGTDRQALQTSFERQLATLGLAGLDVLGDDRESRYETLARLYSYVLVVQDSPRLPAATQTNLLGAIQALVAGEPPAPALEAVRAQFTQFRRAAQRTPPVIAQIRAPQTSVNRAAETEAKPIKNVTRTLTDTAGATPDAPVTRAVDQTEDASTGAVSTSVEPEGALGSLRELRAPLLIAAGLFALVALAGSLRALRGGLSPWQNAALALLLLPTLGEGFIALAETLGPRAELPLLTGLGRYSVFTNPVTQLVWPLLTAVAVLCLALGWRTPVHAAKDAELKAPSSKPSPSEPATHPRLAGSNLNWDEDF